MCTGFVILYVGLVILYMEFEILRVGFVIRAGSSISEARVKACAGWARSLCPGHSVPTRAVSALFADRAQLREVKGDLFSCPPSDALAHCISEDCRMGAGIAVLFKKKFGGVQELLDQKKKTGEVAVLQRDDRYIYYLITKQKVSHKPTYESMRKSLEAMRAHCLHNGVTDISMPRIGCGLDGLQWDKVSAILGEVFENTDIKITVYSL
ncbi:ADP-ribose glycohydrolase OARD1 isoform X1 [Pipra filicauda]|uniref:ADP-ribose glycohydrolase OARD1 n=1 Tax=Pipra filicauda TaxID=649802 RepID=A0A6J2ISN1_9PASS|nr:ADP-ribose glycohydrolase OARD1 isoform X1 [Pipra filicauda]